MYQNNKNYYRFKSIISNLQFIDKSILLNKDLILEEDKGIKIYYAPFEYINKDAKIIIIGITPGFTQMQISYRELVKGINNNLTDLQILQNVKKEASFAGVMRKNLVEMLDELNINTYLKISTTDKLFKEYNHLLHSTSVIKYPVFVNNHNYTGHTPNILKTKILYDYIFDGLGKELTSIPDAIIIPLGKIVQDSLNLLIYDNKIDSNRILLNFSHPSGANVNRKNFFNKNKKHYVSQIEKLFK